MDKTGDIVVGEYSVSALYRCAIKFFKFIPKNPYAKRIYISALNSTFLNMEFLS